MATITILKAFVGRSGYTNSIFCDVDLFVRVTDTTVYGGLVTDVYTKHIVTNIFWDELDGATVTGIVSSPLWSGGSTSQTLTWPTYGIKNITARVETLAGISSPYNIKINVTENGILVIPPNETPSIKLLKVDINYVPGYNVYEVRYSSEITNTVAYGGLINSIYGFGYEHPHIIRFLWDNLDGGVMQTDRNSPEFCIRWGTAGVKNLSARIETLLGFSAPFNFTYNVEHPTDIIPPVLTSFSTAGSGLTVNVNMETNDNASISSWILKAYRTIPYASINKLTQYTFNEAGKHTLWATVKDSTGNISNEICNEPESIIITGVTSVITSGQNFLLTINHSLRDGDYLANVEFLDTDGGIVSAGNALYYKNIAFTTTGTKNITLRCLSGLYQIWTSHTFSINVPEIVKPIITISIPDNTTKPLIPINITASNNTVEYLVNTVNDQSTAITFENPPTFYNILPDTTNICVWAIDDKGVISDVATDTIVYTVPTEKFVVLSGQGTYSVDIKDIVTSYTTNPVIKKPSEKFVVLSGQGTYSVDIKDIVTSYTTNPVIEKPSGNFVVLSGQGTYIANIKPIQVNFTLPSEYSTPNITIKTFTTNATNPQYAITTTLTEPVTWETTVPTTITGGGNSIFYAWVKDSDGNISLPVSAKCNSIICFYTSTKTGETTAKLYTNSINILSLVNKDKTNYLYLEGIPFGKIKTITTLTNCNLLLEHYNSAGVVDGTLNAGGRTLTCIEVISKMYSVSTIAQTCVSSYYYYIVNDILYTSDSSVILKTKDTLLDGSINYKGTKVGTIINNSLFDGNDTNSHLLDTFVDASGLILMSIKATFTDTANIKAIQGDSTDVVINSSIVDTIIEDIKIVPTTTTINTVDSSIKISDTGTLPPGTIVTTTTGTITVGITGTLPPGTTIVTPDGNIVVGPNGTLPPGIVLTLYLGTSIVIEEGVNGLVGKRLIVNEEYLGIVTSNTVNTIVINSPAGKTIRPINGIWRMETTTNIGRAPLCIASQIAVFDWPAYPVISTTNSSYDKVYTKNINYTPDGDSLFAVRLATQSVTNVLRHEFPAWVEHIQVLSNNTYMLDGIESEEVDIPYKAYYADNWPNWQRGTEVTIYKEAVKSQGASTLYYTANTNLVYSVLNTPGALSTIVKEKVSYIKDRIFIAPSRSTSIVVVDTDGHLPPGTIVVTLDGLLVVDITGHLPPGVVAVTTTSTVVVDSTGHLPTGTILVVPVDQVIVDVDGNLPPDTVVITPNGPVTVDVDGNLPPGTVIITPTGSITVDVDGNLPPDTIVLVLVVGPTVINTGIPVYMGIFSSLKYYPKFSVVSFNNAKYINIKNGQYIGEFDYTYNYILNDVVLMPDNTYSIFNGIDFEQYYDNILLWVLLTDRGEYSITNSYKPYSLVIDTLTGFVYVNIQIPTGLPGIDSKWYKLNINDSIDVLYIASVIEYAVVPQSIEISCSLIECMSANIVLDEIAILTMISNTSIVVLCTAQVVEYISSTFNVSSNIVTSNRITANVELLVEQTVNTTRQGTTIQLKRGDRANLPVSASVGEALVTLDTGELYIGTGTGLRKIADVIVSITVPAVEDQNKLWYNPAENVTRVWKDFVWQVTGSESSMDYGVF